MKSTQVAPPKVCKFLTEDDQRASSIINYYDDNSASEEGKKEGPAGDSFCKT